MALTTLQGVLDGLRPAFSIQKGSPSTSTTAATYDSAWYQSPNPASVATPGLSGAALTYPVTGAFQLDDAGSGETVIARASAVNRAAAGSGTMNGYMLVDRLWHNSGITITSTAAQTINSVTWPARDINQSTNGRGVYVAVEVTSSTGAGTPTLTLGYTNDAGTSGRTATSIVATGASAGQGRFYIFALQEGDTGVRSIQTLTLSASWTSGGIILVAFRPIILMPIFGSGNMKLARTVDDVVSLAAPRIWSQSVLQIVNIAGSYSGPPLAGGSMQLSQG